MSFSYSNGVITQSNEASKSITAFANGGSDTLTVSVSAHGYSAGDLVDITGTTNYNGVYIINSVTTNSFNIDNTDIFGVDNAFAGTETGSVERGDKDLSGMAGLTGVTVSGITYVFDSSTTLIHNGALLIDGTVNTLLFQRSGGNIMRAGSGKIKITGLITNTTPNYVSKRPVIDFGEQTSSRFMNITDVDKALIEGFISYYGNGTTGLIALNSDVTIKNGGIIDGNKSVGNDQFVANAGKYENAYLQGTYIRGGNSAAFENINGLTIEGATTGLLFNYSGPLHDVVLGDLTFINNNGNSIRYNNTGNKYSRARNNGNGDSIVTNVGGSGANSKVIVDNTFTITIKDTDRNALPESKIYAFDVDNGSRDSINYGDGESYEVATSGTLIYSANANASGVVLFDGITNPAIIAIVIAQGGTKDFRGNSNTGAITFKAIEYTKSIGQLTPNHEGIRDKNVEFVLLPDFSISEMTKSTVDAYTELETSKKFYDKAKAYLYDNFQGESETLVNRSGNQIDAGSYDVTIDDTAITAFDLTGNLITIKASIYRGDIITTGNITRLNSASFIGTFTDAAGTTTITELTLTGLKANTEIRIYEAGTTTEIDGVENSGTTFATTTSASSVDIVVHALGYEYQRLNAVDTSQNLTLPISQQSDRNYSNP
jgi:hypothetical protein